MIKKIDLYILKKFLGTFFYSITLLMVVVIVFDISEKVDDFIKHQAPLHTIVFDYFFNFIPYFANFFSPLFTFISVILFTSKMATNTEIVAILSSGVSFRRFLRSYFIGSCFIALASLYLANWVIPTANKNRYAFQEKYLWNPFQTEDNNIHKFIEPGTLIYVERYVNSENLGTRFSLEKIKDGRLTFKLMAANIKWDSTSQKWSIFKYVMRSIEDNKENVRMGEKLDTTLNLKPEDFRIRAEKKETMNYNELNEFIKIEKQKGSDKIEIFEIEKYQRFAFPFATIILTLIGVALSSRKVRGGIGMHIGLGLIISFSYILFMQVTTTFAAGGIISPFVSVWIPNILFGGIALFLLRNAPK